MKALWEKGPCYNLSIKNSAWYIGGTQIQHNVTSLIFSCQWYQFYFLKVHYTFLLGPRKMQPSLLRQFQRDMNTKAETIFQISQKHFWTHPSPLFPCLLLTQTFSHTSWILDRYLRANCNDWGAESIFNLNQIRLRNKLIQPVLSSSQWHL